MNQPCLFPPDPLPPRTTIPQPAIPTDERLAQIANLSKQMLEHNGNTPEIITDAFRRILHLATMPDVWLRQNRDQIRDGLRKDSVKIS